MRFSTLPVEHTEPLCISVYLKKILHNTGLISQISLWIVHCHSSRKLCHMIYHRTKFLSFFALALSLRTDNFHICLSAQFYWNQIMSFCAVKPLWCWTDCVFVCSGWSLSVVCLCACLVDFKSYQSTCCLTWQVWNRFSQLCVCIIE